MSDPIRVEDWKEVADLVKVYELQPGKHYLILADAKGYSVTILNKLFANLRADHPELDVLHVVATPSVSKIKLMEKKDEEEKRGSEEPLPGEAEATEEKPD